MTGTSSSIPPRGPRGLAGLALAEGVAKPEGVALDEAEALLEAICCSWIMTECVGRALVDIVTMTWWVGVGCIMTEWVDMGIGWGRTGIITEWVDETCGSGLAMGVCTTECVMDDIAE